MGMKPRIPAALRGYLDMDLINELGRRGYALKVPDSKKDQEMAVDLCDVNTGTSRPMRKMTILVPQGSPLWWPEKE